ncbi:hypothetical protein JCM8547_002852 [Rhodosporidiobolus lusitaniae]
MTALVPPSSLPRTRRPPAPPAPSNTLVLLLPPLLLAHPPLLASFELHFRSYGTLLSWTVLEQLGRAVAVYERDEDAREARGEMDGFVWEDDDEQSAEGQPSPQPLRVFYGPQLQITHIPSTSASSHQVEQVLLTVPSSGKNFLISPPGSPPVGWEQTSEEAPNSQVFHPEDGIEPVELRGEDGRTKGFSEGWADELTRALRFLSVNAGEEEDSLSPSASAAAAAQDEEDDASDDPSPERQTTQLVLPPSSTSSTRPAVTVSSPPPSHPSVSTTSPSTPVNSKSRDITQVKATLDSLLGRKRSMSDLRRRSSSEGGGHRRSGSASSLEAPPRPAIEVGLGAGLGGETGPRITPTARPPLASS